MIPRSLRKRGLGIFFVSLFINPERRPDELLVNLV
jgi:hypothetical protein